MINKVLRRIARGSAVLAATIGLGGLTAALAGNEEPRAPSHFNGLINDYTPSAAITKGGPYEMRGKWSLEVDERHGTTRFEAVMNMETSDYGISELIPNAQGVLQPLVNKDDPTTRGAHTHHILMTDGKISASSSDWMTSCPKFSPAVTGGVVISGTAFVTGNGGPPPFGNPSMLTLCILGAGNVKYSNFTMAFDSKSKASGHFGSQPIHGVVLRCAGPWQHQSKDCSVENTEE
ncbi:MAG TPA: hypothetical protein VHS76_06730 [Steroidobacteraceae bacterium]|nr:hypothetical protein [Steroidobacteraceae bacterium]